MKTPIQSILLVEDNPVNRMAMEALLARLGFPFEVASSGREAIEAFGARAHSLVLMDLMMPEMDGFQAARTLRQQEFGTGRRTPIVAITAHDPELVYARCLEVGIDDILTKPVDDQRLGATIRLWVGVSSLGAMEPVSSTPLTTKGAQNGDAVLSKRVLQSIYGSENMRRIVTTFMTVTESMLAELEVAIGAHDDAVIRKTLHELKSATLEVRARQMARLCLELELAVDKSDRVEMLAIYAALAHAFLRVKALDVETPAATSATAQDAG